jgi:hypothetical protein
VTSFHRANRRRAIAHVKPALPEVVVTARRLYCDEIRAVAWGPLNEETRAEDRQRIAEQKAKDFGAGQLV